MDNDIDLNIGPDSPEGKKDKDKPDIEELAKSFNDDKEMSNDSENLDKIEIPELEDISIKDDEGKTGAEDIAVSGDKTIPELDAVADKSEELEKIDFDDISFDLGGESKEEEGKVESAEPGIPEALNIEGITGEEKKETEIEDIAIPGDKTGPEPDADADKSEELKKIDLDSVSFDLGGESKEEEGKVESAEPDIPKTSELPVSPDNEMKPTQEVGEEQPARISSMAETAPEVKEEKIQPADEKKLKKKKSKVPLLIFLCIIVCAGYYFLFMRKKEEPLVVKKSPVKQIKKIESPYIYTDAENVQKDVSDGITTYVYDTDADMDTVQKFYRQKMITLKYKLKSDKYESRGDYTHLVFSGNNKDCSIVLRRQDDKVIAVVSYVE